MNGLMNGLMKWMMSGVAVLAAGAFLVALEAQSVGAMAQGDKMDTMKMKDTTYTGCVEAGSTPGMFTLTHLTVDGMSKDSMKKDAMNKETMNHDTTNKDAMAPSAVSLTSSSIDLSKHVGHKVSVTGSAAHGKMDTMESDAMRNATSALTVKSLKMVAASCS